MQHSHASHLLLDGSVGVDLAAKLGSVSCMIHLLKRGKQQSQSHMNCSGRQTDEVWFLHTSSYFKTGTENVAVFFFWFFFCGVHVDIFLPSSFCAKGGSLAMMPTTCGTGDGSWRDHTGALVWQKMPPDLKINIWRGADYTDFKNKVLGQNGVVISKRNKWRGMQFIPSCLKKSKAHVTFFLFSPLQFPPNIWEQAGCEQPDELLRTEVSGLLIPFYGNELQPLKAIYY